MKRGKYIKCVLVGDGEVGKTSLIISYTSDIFEKAYIPTVYDTVSVAVMVNNMKIDVSLWDTAGQDEFDQLRQLAYPETNVFILCFSLENRTSFLNIKSKWCKELTNFSRETPTILVGTKLDKRCFVEDGSRHELDESCDEFVRQKEGYNLGKEIKAFRYIECSSVTQMGVKEVFDQAIIAALGMKEDISCHCVIS